MKKVLALVAISALFTGCAATSPNEPSLGSKVLCGYGVCTDEVKTWANTKLFNRATLDCQKMGHKEGTIFFSNCVQTLVENERTRIANYNAASEAARINATPRQVQCRQVGSYIHCNEL